MIFNAINNINSDNELDDIEENESEWEEQRDDDNVLMADEEVNNEIMEIETYLNLVDKELATLLRTQEIQVVIEPTIVDHEDKVFNLEELLQEEFDK